jgi:hypothetical protein
MGCGSSRLKGEDVPDLNSQQVSVAPTPMKKVNTNFSAVDYEQESRDRRMTEYAPEETVIAKPPQQQQQQRSVDAGRPSVAVAQTTMASTSFGQTEDAYQYYDTNAHAGGARSGSGAGALTGASNGDDGDNDGTNLKPYQTIDDRDWENDHSTAAHHDPGFHNGTDELSDPTSSRAKAEFAEENDPANVNQEEHYVGNNDDFVASLAYPHDERNNGVGGVGPEDKYDDDDNNNEHKKSWLGQKYASFQAAKQGPGISDDDLKKYTGRDRAEFDEWAANRSGVGGDQGAGRAGTDSAQAYATPYAVS